MLVAVCLDGLASGEMFLRDPFWVRYSLSLVSSDISELEEGLMMILREWQDGWRQTN